MDPIQAVTKLTAFCPPDKGGELRIYCNEKGIESETLPFKTLKNWSVRGAYEVAI